jgi:hypothetical protein
VASVRRRRDAGKAERWIIQWRDARGRVRQRSLVGGTQREAEREAFEEERRADRQRRGLEPMDAENGGGTLADLLRRWHKVNAQKASAERNLFVMEKHLLRSPLGEKRLAELKASDVENYLDEKQAEGLGPQSINHLRGFISRASTPRGARAGGPGATRAPT